MRKFWIFLIYAIVSRMVRKMRVARAIAMPMLMVWIGVKSGLIYSVEGKVVGFLYRQR